MDSRIITRSGTVALAIAMLLSAAPASAVLDADAVKCRDTIAKNMGKLLKTGNKVIGGCHKTRNKDMTGDDCNDIDVADLAKGKYAATETKTVEAIAKSCSTLSDVFTTINDDGSDKEWYVSCPVVGCVGSSDLITTMSEVSACLLCIAEETVESVATDTLGLPTGLDSDEAKCHGALAKSYAKYFDAAYKSETSCQSNADDAGENDYTLCADDDTKGKVEKARLKAIDSLEKSCTGLTLADLDGCSAVDVASLAACSEAAWKAAEDEAYGFTYFMENTVNCPTTIRTTILGGCSTVGTTSNADGCSVGAETGTVLSVGWKGIAHGVDVTDKYTLAVDVTCAGTEKGSCGTCTSTGISYDNPQYDDFVRCSDEPWVRCDEPLSADADDCGGDTCRYYLGPPLAVSAGGTPTCTLNVINQDIIGATGDPDLGTVDFTVELRALVHNGIGQQRPCPYCRNDPAPQDGNTPSGTCEGGSDDGGLCRRDADCPGGGTCEGDNFGKCSGGSENGSQCADDDDCPLGDCVGNFGSCFGGPRANQPCDVQGFDLSFANVDGLDEPNSGNSLDCPPLPGANISGGGLEISLPLSTGLSTKTTDDFCEAPNGTLECFCGICSLAQTQSCASDADCMGVGVCTAGGMAAGVARKPNDCSDGVCVAVSSDRGECSNGAGDIDSYCSGLLFANGKGVLACGTNGDCTSYESGSPDPDLWVCPGNDCGTCSVSAFRSCFNDPISISGTPNPENPILAGTFCLPPSSNGAVNSATGSPGPGTVQTDTLVEQRF
jgi:hypothetical protein